MENQHYQRLCKHHSWVTYFAMWWRNKRKVVDVQNGTNSGSDRLALIFCLWSFEFVLGRGSIWSDKIDRTCTIPKGAGDEEKCDWGQNKKVIIGGCQENQCLTLSGRVLACEKDGQTVVSASLSVEVDFDVTFCSHSETKPFHRHIWMQK